jgi:hypothetical protein
MSEAIDAWPLLEISRRPDAIAASAFSQTMRWYSAGEHLFCKIRSMRRAAVSQDASIKSAIIKGRHTVLRSLVSMAPLIIYPCPACLLHPVFVIGVQKYRKGRRTKLSAALKIYAISMI